MNLNEALKIYTERTGTAVETNRIARCPRCREDTLQAPSEVRKQDFTDLYGVVSYSILWRCSVCNAVTFKQGWQEE